MRDTEDPPVIHYGPIATDLEEPPKAILNRIRTERQRSLEGIHKGLPALLKSVARVADATWRAVKYLALDKRHGDAPPASLAVAIPPLARTFLDHLMLVIFIVEAPADRATWYYRSGWREAAELQKRLDARYGADPSWTNFLTSHRQWVQSHEPDLAITPQERADPRLATARWRKPGWWPNPGKIQSLSNDPANRAFLQFVSDWYYGRLSQDSHLSYMGMVRQAGILQDDQPIEAYRNQAVLSAITLYVALLSEIVVAASLPYEAKRVRRIWGHLKDYGDAAELWTARYHTHLASL